MTYHEEIPIYNFKAHTNYPQVIFNDLIRTALAHKFDSKPIIKVTPKILTEAIFNLSNHDKITMEKKQIDGQKLKELFITCVYLKYVDNVSKNKYIFVSLPIKDESYDTAVYAAAEGSWQRMGQKIKLVGPDVTAYYIQIKEDVDFSNIQEFDSGQEPREISPDNLEKKVRGYSELVLIYSRNYGVFNSQNFQPFLHKYKNAGLITVPSTTEGPMEYTRPDGSVEKIDFEPRKFHFLIQDYNNTIHVKFDEPNFLIPEQALHPDINSALNRIAEGN